MKTRQVTVVIGVRANPEENQRIRNAKATLLALNLQDIPRWNYRIILVEQDIRARLKADLSPVADRYIFAPNPGPYNRGWAFNIGTSLAARTSNVLCLVDADILVPPDFLRRGLTAFNAGHLAVQPYSEIAYLDAGSTKRAIQDRLASSLEAFEVNDYLGTVFSNSQGGCIWVDTTLYLNIGGHDENFRGWGCEDREFWDRLARNTSTKQLSGRLLHLDHPEPSKENRCFKANQLLYRKRTLRDR